MYVLSLARLYAIQPPKQPQPHSPQPGSVRSATRLLKATLLPGKRDKEACEEGMHLHKLLRSPAAGVSSGRAVQEAMPPER
jgi:hypothetical protein